MTTQYQIVPGSMGAMAQQSGKTIAETFVNASCVILVDTSGSMEQKDSRGGQSRYQVACDELAALQQSMPGKIAVVSFSDEVMFCPAGVPFNLSGGTNMVKALYFAKMADVPGMQFILISDGSPDKPEETLEAARTFKNKINVIYVGPENSPTGRDFLNRLAALTGGQAVTADRAQALQSAATTLLLGA